MKVRSLVDKFTLKGKRKYIAKGEIYDVLHEEERGYCVVDIDGDEVILQLSECEVLEYDNLHQTKKIKCEVLKQKYGHRLREDIQCFLEENKIERIEGLSCYFDSSIDIHVAVIIYW
jgi:hypothetical protein